MNTERRQSRFIRSSLRAMLVVFLLFAAFMATIGRRISLAHSQRSAREEIASLEAITGFAYDWQVDGQVVDENGSRLATQPPGPEWARELLGDDFLYRVVEVDVCNGNVTDDDLSPLSKFTGLRSLTLLHIQLEGPGLQHISDCKELTALLISNCPLSDAGLRPLHRLANLKHLRLCDTKVSDEGLQRIQGLSKLEHLDLAYTDVSDEGLKYVANFNQLESLVLSSTSVTNAGLPQLYGLSRLKTLWLPKSPLVTESAIDTLKTKLPDCVIKVSPF